MSDLFRSSTPTAKSAPAAQETFRRRRGRRRCRPASDRTHAPGSAGDRFLSCLCRSNRGRFAGVAGAESADPAAWPHTGFQNRAEPCLRECSRQANESNLDVRIDTPPSSNGEEANGDGALKDMLKKAKVRAALQLHGSEADGDGVFVRLHSTIVFRGACRLGGTVAQQAIQALLSPGLTASRLGVEWKKAGTGAQSYSELDGLAQGRARGRGKCLFVSNDPATLASRAGANLTTGICRICYLLRRLRSYSRATELLTGSLRS